jgi:polysaccharide biosynthesis transport protein
VLLLVQHRRNPHSMVVRAQQIIEGLHKQIVGVVLNRVPANSSDDYGYYTRNYAYYSSREDRSSRRKKRSQEDKSEGRRGDERISFSERGGERRRE